MADFITQVGNVTQLISWYTSTVPSSIPSGDRYIAELAAGDYVLNGLSWTGKTLATAGQLIIRPAAGAYHNTAGTPARVKGNSAGPVLVTNAGIDSSFGCNVAGGFVFTDLQISCPNTGGFQFDSGSQVQRCAVSRSSNLGSALRFYNSCRVTNTLFVMPSGGGVCIFSGAGPIVSNTFIAFADSGGFVQQGTFSNAVWVNNYCLNLGGSSDPWPTPPSFYYTTASCTNNGTSNSAAGNCPGSAVVTNAGAVQLSGTASFAALDAVPVSGSTLRAAAVANALNGGVDWYGSARPGSPGIGAVEYSATPSAIAGGATLDDVAPASDLVCSSSQITGGPALDGLKPASDLSVAPGFFTSQPLKTNNGTLLASKSLVHVTLYREDDGTFVVRKTGLSTDGSGVFSVSDVAIVPGTQYKVDWQTAEGHRRMPMAAAT